MPLVSSVDILSKRKKMATKIDDFGVGGCWLAMITLVSELQQCNNSKTFSRTGRSQHGPTTDTTAARSWYWQTHRNGRFFGRFTRAPKALLN